MQVGIVGEVALALATLELASSLITCAQAITFEVNNATLGESAMGAIFMLRPCRTVHYNLGAFGWLRNGCFTALKSFVYTCQVCRSDGNGAHC
jgi:hypothetical protein